MYTILYIFSQWYFQADFQAAFEMLLLTRMCTFQTGGVPHVAGGRDESRNDLNQVWAYSAQTGEWRESGR